MTKLALGAKFAKYTKLTKIPLRNLRNQRQKICVHLCESVKSVSNFPSCLRVFVAETQSIKNNKLCKTNPIFQMPKMNLSPCLTMDYENKSGLLTMAKQTQSNPIYGELAESTCSELACPELVERVEPILSASGGWVKRWNLFCGSSDFYNRIMRKSRNQIYDELLILKCQAGEKAAFEELVGRWEKRLWHYAYKVTGSDSAAWDIVQETWVGVIKGIRKLVDVAVFPQWTFKILNNKCADWLRSRHLQYKLDSELSEQTQNESDARQNIDIRSELLYADIVKLSSEQRALLMLRYHEDFDICQIAEVLGVPEGTVKSRLHRTLNQLRQMVERHQND